METLAFNTNWYSILLDQLGWNVTDMNIINKIPLNICKVVDKVHIFWVFEITDHLQKKVGDFVIFLWPSQNIRTLVMNIVFNFQD